MRRFVGAILLTHAPAAAVAGPPEYDAAITLYAAAHAGGVISLVETDAQRTLTVDVAKRLILLITSPVELETTLDLPDGSQYSLDRPDDRRRWHRFTRERTDDAYLWPGVGIGYNDHITMDRPPPGRYIVRLRRTGPAVESAPFLITLLQDSELRMGLAVPSREALSNAPFLVAALVYDRDRPIRGASVVATVTREPPDRVSAGVPAGEVVLADEGRGVDTTRGDGIYTGILMPRKSGRYLVAIHATGVSSAGVAFERHAGLSFEASEPTVEISGVEPSSWRRRAPLQLIDRLVVPVAIRGPAGAYEILVNVRARNGRRTAASEQVTLGSAENARASIGVEAARIRTLGVDGAYAIESIEVFEIGNQARILRARRVDRDKTPPVKLSELATE